MPPEIFSYLFYIVLEGMYRNPRRYSPPSTLCSDRWGASIMWSICLDAPRPMSTSVISYIHVDCSKIDVTWDSSCGTPRLGKFTGAGMYRCCIHRSSVSSRSVQSPMYKWVISAATLYNGNTCGTFACYCQLLSGERENIHRRPVACMLKHSLSPHQKTSI